MMKIQWFMIIMWSIMLTILFTLTSGIYLHPTFIMIMLIMYSIMICLNLSLWKPNFIYSIMLFLIMISGILIIFLYFSSLISNDQPQIFFNNKLLPSYSMNLMLLIYLFMNLNTFKNMHYSMNENKSLNMINEKLNKNILNLYEYPFNIITILCMTYLLITLFTIIKICSMKSLPLRKIK